MYASFSVVVLPPYPFSLPFHIPNNMAKNKQHKKTEEQKKEEDGTESNKAGGGDIILGIYLHCQGCVETVVKALKGFDGVEEIEPNTKDHRVIVKGKTADPISVAERVRHKLRKHVELIHPIPKKQPEKKVEKPEAPKVVETVLKMNLHCEGCAKDVKQCLHKMQGVQTVNIDMKLSHVTVKGVFDPKNLVTYISKRAGKQAEMVNAKNTKNNDGEQTQEKKQKEKDAKNTEFAYPNVPPGLVYAPQLFSDENPNACSIL